VKLSVVVPAYNEEATVETLLRRVRQLPFVVGDDASTDGTTKRLRALAERFPELRVLKHRTKRGKGAALRIYEVPISYSGRTYEEGKKITWKDAVKALFAIIYFRFFDECGSRRGEAPAARHFARLSALAGVARRWPDSASPCTCAITGPRSSGGGARGLGWRGGGG
jgi:hypothetical protein